MNPSSSHHSYQPVVVWVGQPSLWSYSGALLLGFLLLPFYGFGLLFFFWVAIQRSTAEYVILTGKIFIRVGLLVKSSRELRIADIRSINISRHGIGGLFGIGDVEFSSAASAAGAVVFWGVSNAEQIANIVRAIQDGHAPQRLNAIQPIVEPWHHGQGPLNLPAADLVEAPRHQGPGSLALPVANVMQGVVNVGQRVLVAVGIILALVIVLAAISSSRSSQQSATSAPTDGQAIQTSAYQDAAIPSPSLSLAPATTPFASPSPTVRKALPVASAAPISPIPQRAPEISAPKYTVFRTWTNSDLLGGIVIISPRDVNDAKLTALAKELNGKYRQARRVMIQVFTDKKAALIRDKALADQTHADGDFLEAHYVMGYLRNDYQGINDAELMTKGMNGPFATVKLNE